MLYYKKFDNYQGDDMYKKFHLEFSEPTIVGQGRPQDNRWGQNQFPAIYKTVDNKFYATWDFGTDDIYYNIILQEAVSNDGVLWNKVDGPISLICPKMPNGNFFCGFVRKGTHKINYHKKYNPAYVSKNGRKLYFADDIKEEEDKSVYGIEIDSKTGAKTTFRCNITWPNMPFLMPNEDEVYPATMVFKLSEKAIVPVGDELYYPLYIWGFNSDALSKNNAMQKYPDSFAVYFFNSKDGGKSWNYLSQILVDDDSFNPNDGFEGFAEPYMTVMADGSFVMLIRTGSNHPSYITRSTDGGKTWEKVKVFDDIGVFPQIKHLKCGVTIASYGRPRLKVRATSDPYAINWQDPIEIKFDHQTENNLPNSCFYTGLLPISDTEMLFIYSDFEYPNKDGIKTKTILCRKITVIFDE